MRKNQKGFSAVEGLLIFIIVAIIAGVGWYVWDSNKKTNNILNSADKSSNATPISTKKKTTTDKTTPDPYSGWKGYTNSKYGISFKYPTTWALSDESQLDPSKSATKQEFATGLKLTTDTKYNNTVGVEVLDESLSTAGAWYDNNYNQSPLITKTTNTLKGKSSVQYDVTNSGVNSKLYLFGVGDKTYSFWSVNEQLNTQADSNYWTTFSKVFDSFQIQ
jgi:hypothetical protein